jgi:OmpA-OmpF porin, OOP family
MSSAFHRSLKVLAIAAALLPAVAMAQKNLGYLVTQSGDVVLGNAGAPLGPCWRAGTWTPALAASAEACKQCDPDLCPKPPPPPPPPPPKPAAPPPPPPPKPVPQNVELKIELQGIAFNKTELTDDNKKELDDFLAKEVKPLNNIGAMIITGHTDRIGSDAYNKKLSEKRAVYAKDYVVSKGVDSKVIFWEGKGKAQPIPVTKFCDNKMKRPQLIECLAPNRRVTVEVVGTKLVPPPKPAAPPPPAEKPAAKPDATPAAPAAKPEAKPAAPAAKP